MYKEFWTRAKDRERDSAKRFVQGGRRVAAGGEAGGGKAVLVSVAKQKVNAQLFRGCVGRGRTRARGLGLGSGFRGRGKDDRRRLKSARHKDVVQVDPLGPKEGVL